MAYVNPAAEIGTDQIRIIHVVKSKLGLDDTAYRAILWGAAHASSSKGLTFREYWAVMDRLKEIGKERHIKIWAGNGIKKKKEKMVPFQQPNQGVYVSRNKQKAILGLWEDVARVKTPQALRTFIKNRFGVDDLRFADEETGDKVIEALKQMKLRQDPTWSGVLGD